MDPYGADHTFSGGNTYTHFLSANIYFEQVNRADARILDDKDQRVGATIRATVEKSKFGPWPRRTEFKVSFDTGIINPEEEIALLAMDYGIIDRPSAQYYSYGETKWHGQDKMHQAIAADATLATELTAKISEARAQKNQAKMAEQDTISAKLIEADIEETEASIPEPKTKRKTRSST
jgi:hypothetical protein